MAKLTVLPAAIILFCAIWILVGAASAMAADPGLIIPSASEASDQKSGSVLVYNLYTSSTIAPSVQNTRLSITNNSNFSAGFVRLFFIDGTTGFTSDSTICLTAQQTASFKASDIRPGQTGYLIAVAIDGVTGCPTPFNFLSGQATLKFPSGHAGTLGAIAHAALYAGTLPGCDANSTTATLQFNGIDYNRQARILQVADVPGIVDASTMVVVNRLSGNLQTAASNIGALTGSLFNDVEFEAGFSTFIANPQLRAELTNAFPVTAPNFSTMIPAGRTGWMKLFTPTDVGLSGSVLYLTKLPVSSIPSSIDERGQRSGQPDPVPASAASVLSAGGVNMRALTLSPVNQLTIPVRAPSCF